MAHAFRCGLACWPWVSAPVPGRLSASSPATGEASLSFLGLGTQPPTPSWGLMLSSTGRAFMEQAPWLAIFPGLAIGLAVLSFNLFGDTLRGVWDPQLRGRS